MAHGTFQHREEFLPARGEVLVVIVCEDLPRWRRQETSETSHLLDVLDGDFRVWHRIGFGRYWLAVDRFLHGRQGRRHPHFLGKRTRVEIDQSGNRGLATE